MPVPMIAIVSPLFTESFEGAVLALNSTASGFIGGNTPLESFFWAETTCGLKQTSEATDRDFRDRDFITNSARVDGETVAKRHHRNYPRNLKAIERH